MKAHKIELAGYSIKQLDENGQPITINVVDNLVGLVLHPVLQLNGSGLLQHHKLADKLLAQPEAYAGGDGQSSHQILLDAQDYGRLKRAVETFKGFGRPHVELVRRVLEAPEVEVEEAAKTQEE